MTIKIGIINETDENESPRHQLAAPIAATDRIASLDVLRGFALLGILLANIQDFASPTGILHDIPLDVVSQRGARHALDVAVMIAQWIFVEGKMRALFGLLFGAGTVLLLERIERRAGPELAADVFHRRNMWLLFFGIIHGTLIWNGDILLFYGSFALLALYPLRTFERIAWLRSAWRCRWQGAHWALAMGWVCRPHGIRLRYRNKRQRRARKTKR